MDDNYNKVALPTSATTVLLYSTLYSNTVVAVYTV